MRKQIQILQDIVSRKGSSKVLTFSIPHVYKAFQLLSSTKYVSRATFCKELHLGEGAVKTLILHLKEEDMVKSNKSGTFLTENGIKYFSKLEKIITNECNIKKCSIGSDRYNHAIILKNYSSEIKTGLQQRDFAILYGATGCTTLLYKNNRFVFPNEYKDCLAEEPLIRKQLIENLHPENGDVIIISSSDDPFVAEISAKNSALWTLATT